MVQVKRVYEPASSDDGFRVLVDRLWPRGLTKEKVGADRWLKEVAPSTELRKWFQHDPEKWFVFKEKYKAELNNNGAFAELKTIVQEHKKVTLLYAAKDETHNEAQVLKEQMSTN